MTGDIFKGVDLIMAVQKISLEQMGRQYLAASNFEMARLIVAKTGICSGQCLELSAGSGRRYVFLRRV
jgi:hypothetical protein